MDSEKTVPEGLTVFAIPPEYRKKRTSNHIRKAVNQQIYRRIRSARIFPNQASLLKLVEGVNTSLGVSDVMPPPKISSPANSCLISL